MQIRTSIRWVATVTSIVMLATMSACQKIKTQPLQVKVLSSGLTARSEIKRGLEAAKKCFNDYDEYDEFNDCINNTESTNLQKMQIGFESFDTGLYFSSWAVTSDWVDTRSPEATDLAIVTQFRNKSLRSYLGSRKNIGLSDAQVLDAVGVPGQNLTNIGSRLRKAENEYGTH